MLSPHTYTQRLVAGYFVRMALILVITSTCGLTWPLLAWRPPRLLGLVTLRGVPWYFRLVWLTGVFLVIREPERAFCITFPAYFCH